MNTILKKQILDKKTFASNQIGPLAYLVHKMSGQGDFSVKVSDGNIQKMQFAVICSPKDGQYSVNIDVSVPESVQKPILLNSENGYLLFFHSKEFVNWKIEITKTSANNILEFDSYKPDQGDLMALNLIKPGRYSLKSSANQSEIVVMHPEEITLQKKMNVTSNRFSRNDFKIKQRKIVSPNQGIVFEFSKELSSFSVNLVEEKTAKTSFDERLRKDFKTKLTARKRPAVLIQKKYKWTGKNKPIK